VPCGGRLALRPSRLRRFALRADGLRGRVGGLEDRTDLVAEEPRDLLPVAGSERFELRLEPLDRQVALLDLCCHPSQVGLHLGAHVAAHADGELLPGDVGRIHHAA
jgi:hypothetical protein